MALKKIAALATAWIFAVTTTAGAGGSWVGDTLNTALGFNPSQQAGGSPSEYQGQQRGYWTGGGYQARAWPNTPEYLFSVEKPHFNVGCGGVDMFLGSYSMMKMEYLAAKMQKIMQQAPTFATLLAIQQLVAPVAENVKQFESILDQLNQLNLNECGMTKTMVAVLQGVGTGSMTGGEALTRFAQEVGIDDNWYGASKKTSTIDYKGGAGPLSSCPADIDKIFLTGTSMLSNLGTMTGIPPEHIDMMRGMFGDVKILLWPAGAGTGERITMSFDPPCQMDHDLGALVEGTAKIKNGGGQCLDIPDPNKSIRQWVQNNTLSIKTKMKARQDLASSEVAFIQAMRAPAYNQLQAAVASGEPAAVIMDIAETSAWDYSYFMIYDLYVRVNAALVAAQSMALNKRDDDTRCKLSLLRGELGYVHMMLESSEKKIRDMREQYATFVNTNAARNSAGVGKFKAYKTAAFDQLSRAFGAHIAARAVR